MGHQHWSRSASMRLCQRKARLFWIGTRKDQVEGEPSVRWREKVIPTPDHPLWAPSWVWWMRSSHSSLSWVRVTDCGMTDTGQAKYGPCCLGLKPSICFLQPMLSIRRWQHQGTEWVGCGQDSSFPQQRSDTFPQLRPQDMIGDSGDACQIPQA